jgi:hypothetical protein
VPFQPGGSWELKDGWKKRENAIIVLIAVISYSGERRGAEIVNNQLMWIDNEKSLSTYFIFIGCVH